MPCLLDILGWPPEGEGGGVDVGQRKCGGGELAGEEGGETIARMQYMREQFF